MPCASAPRPRLGYAFTGIAGSPNFIDPRKLIMNASKFFISTAAAAAVAGAIGLAYAQTGTSTDGSTATPAGGPGAMSTAAEPSVTTTTPSATTTTPSVTTTITPPLSNSNAQAPVVTTTPSTTPAADPSMRNMPIGGTGTGNAELSNSRTTGAGNMRTDGSDMSTERPARADRN